MSDGHTASAPSDDPGEELLPPELEPPPPVEEGDRPLGGLIKHSAIYSAAPVFRQLVSVGMHRLYTGWLATAGFGVKEIVDFWLIGLQQLLGHNVLSAMVRFYFDYKDEDERAKVVTTCTLLVTIGAVLVCGAAFVFSPALAPLMLGKGEVVTDNELVVILQLILVLIPFQMGTISGLYYVQILRRSGLYTSIQTGKLLFEVGLNCIFIGWLGWGVRGFLLSMLIGEAVTALALCGWMLLTLRPRIAWSVMPPILYYAAPLVPVGMLQLALHQIDRRLLLYYGTEGMAQSITGIYGHGYKISYLVTAMVLHPFMLIWQPWIFAVEDEDERSRLIGRISTYAVLVIAAASLGVILFGRQAAILLAKDEAFWDAYKVIPFVAGAYVFWALYHVCQIVLFSAKRTGRLFFANALAVVANVSLCAWLIPRFEYVGAGMATFATFALLSVLAMIASRTVAHVPFQLLRLGAILVCVVAGGAVALWIDDLDASETLAWWTALAIKAATLLALLLVLWFGVLKLPERARLQSWVGEHLPRRG